MALNIVDRRKKRALEAKRDHLLDAKSRVITDLAKTRAELKSMKSQTRTRSKKP